MAEMVGTKQGRHQVIYAPEYRPEIIVIKILFVVITKSVYNHCKCFPCLVY